MNKIIQAAQFAHQAHKDQFRKYTKVKTPYIYHPMRVAGMVMIFSQSEMVEEMAMVAWLHDVLEDTPTTPDDLRKFCSGAVVEWIKDLTNPSKDKNLPRAERKAMDREHIAKLSKPVKIIKLIDRIDNLIDMRDAPADFMKLYRAESLLLLNEALRGTNEILEKQLEELAV